MDKRPFGGWSPVAKRKVIIMKPSVKSEQIEDTITDIFGHDRRSLIKQDQCVPPPIGCGQAATEFRNAISAKEFSISGLCQKCQDSFFGED
jgi:hypothetical protein